MHLSISLLIITALATCTLSLDDCADNEICPEEGPEVCIFHPELYCFIKYDSMCAWNEVRCSYDLDYKEYAIEFCDLENFKCHPRKKKHV